MAGKENIFLRKDGRFEGRYVKGRKENGKLIYGFCYGRTYEEAKQKVHAAMQEMDYIRRMTAPVSGKGGTFADYCGSWLRVNHARLKASSYAKYRSNIINHIMPFFGKRMPYEITSEKVDEFTRLLLDQKHLSAKTVRDILALFHSIFTYVRKRTEQRLLAPEIIYPQRQKTAARVLDKPEEELLIRYLAREMDLYKFGVYIALRTGLRIGEACALRWRDISMSAGTISVCHTVQRICCAPECHDTKTKIVIGPPKSNSSYRMIPLMPDVEALCRRFYREDPENFVLTGTRSCLEPRKLQRKLKAYTAECRIEAVHFHTLRHTFATRCIEAGFDMKTLSEILGHSNISITMNQYVHPNLDQKRENMSRLKTVICI